MPLREELSKTIYTRTTTPPHHRTTTAPHSRFYFMSSSSSTIRICQGNRKSGSACTTKLQDDYDSDFCPVHRCNHGKEENHRCHNARMMEEGWQKIHLCKEHKDKTIFRNCDDYDFDYECDKERHEEQGLEWESDSDTEPESDTEDHLYTIKDKDYILEDFKRRIILTVEDKRRYRKSKTPSKLVKEMKKSVLGMILTDIRKEKSYEDAFLTLEAMVVSEVDDMLDTILSRN